MEKVQNMRKRSHVNIEERKKEIMIVTEYAFLKYLGAVPLTYSEVEYLLI